MNCSQCGSSLAENAACEGICSTSGSDITDVDEGYLEKAHTNEVKNVFTTAFP